jgi:gas vesicle protein
MQTQTQDRRDHRLAIGLVAGAVVGAALTMWFAPRVRAEIRQRLAESTREIRESTFEYQARANARVGETADDLARKGQQVRDDVAGAVARGAHEVERLANASKTAAPPRT